MSHSLKEDILKAAAEKRGRGRPKKFDAFIDRYTLRITQDDIDMLDHISIEDDVRWSEIMRKALKFYYNNWKNTL